MGKYGKKNSVDLNPLHYNIAFLGEGGIGKTTLCYQMCEKLVGDEGYIHFDIGKEDGADAIEGVVTEKIENKLKSSAVSQERDEYFEAAARFVIEKDKASIGMLQRMFKIGFNRAARIVDQLSDAGIVGPEEGTKPRKVLMSSEQLESYFEEYL